MTAVAAFIGALLWAMIHILAAAVGGAVAVVVVLYVLLLWAFATYTGSRFPFRQLDWIALCGLIGVALLIWGVVT